MVIILYSFEKKSNLSNIRVIITFPEIIWILDSLVLNMRKTVIIPSAVDFNCRSEWKSCAYTNVGSFLCLSVPLVSHVTRHGLTHHVNNNHHRTSDVWFRFITQVNSRLSLVAPQYKLCKRHFSFQKLVNLDINEHQSIGVSNITLPVEAEGTLCLNIRYSFIIPLFKFVIGRCQNTITLWWHSLPTARLKPMPWRSVEDYVPLCLDTAGSSTLCNTEWNSFSLVIRRLSARLTIYLHAKFFLYLSILIENVTQVFF
jgi:hypothetical protein